MASIRRRNGKYQVQVRIGKYSTSKSFLLLSDAKDWARAQEIEASGRLFLGRQYQPKNFSEILTRYAKEITPLKRSAENELIVIKALLREAWARFDLRHLRTEDLIKWRDQRLIEVKPATIKRQLNIIKHACTIAERDWDWASPLVIFKRLTLPKSPVHVVRRITPDQQRALVNAAKDCRSPYMAPLIVFALHTAMRRSELLALKWDDVNIQNSELLIRQTKNAHQRLIPLSEIAARQLAAVSRDGSGRVFPISASAVRQAFSRLRCRVGLQHFRFHDLRHESVSRLFEFGLSAVEVAEISGHKSMQQLFKYGHADLGRISKKIDDHTNSENY